MQTLIDSQARAATTWLPRSGHQWFGYAAFWLAVFLLNIGPHWEIYKTTRELLETAGMVTSLQILTAIIALKVLVPRLLSTNRIWLFSLALLAVVALVSQLNILVRFFYLEPLYPDSYAGFLKNYGDMTLWERLDPRWTARYILFTKVPLFLMPTAVLLAFRFHQNQQQALRWREQKQMAELEALRSQLNPHFIFNTLNNIYALTLKKSDQAPLAVEKLSSILDYVVYRCNDQYVNLSDEIELVEDYLALEKLRYGERLKTTVDWDEIASAKIAPLLILTLLENACKHSARNELHQASVMVQIRTLENEISVTISNSKPSADSVPQKEQDKVGLMNLQKQLSLLYPDEHQLKISDQDKRYTVTLVVAKR